MKNWKDQYVSYKIAEKLCILGFDDPCYTVFVKGIIREPWGLGNIDSTEEEFFIRNSEIFAKRDIENGNNNGWVAAPLWQQVIDWLDEQRIFISIKYSNEKMSWDYSIKDCQNYFSGGGFDYGSRKIATEKPILAVLSILENKIK